MKVIDYWAVVVRGDCEGKTRYDKAYFTSQVAAESFSRGIDYYGDDGIVEARQVILFNDAMEAHNSFTGEKT